MKDHNRIKIIGIDHGYGNIKTANICFPSGLIAYEQEPTFKQNLLVYDAGITPSGPGIRSSTETRFWTKITTS